MLSSELFNKERWFKNQTCHQTMRKGRVLDSRKDSVSFHQIISLTLAKGPSLILVTNRNLLPECAVRFVTFF